MNDPLRPVAAAGIVVWRGGEVLLIRRGKPPYEGMWSIPGGRIQPGEPVRETALRELVEETGVTAEIAGLIDVVDSIGDHGHYVLIDFAARWISGEPAAGDDAAEAEFVPHAEALSRLEWDQTRRVIEESRRMLTAQSARSNIHSPSG